MIIRGRRRRASKPQAVYTDPAFGDAQAQIREQRIYAQIGHNSGETQPRRVKPKIARLRLPTLHADQVLAWRMKADPRAEHPLVSDDNGVYGDAWALNQGGRFRAVRCGRRYGKTTLGIVEACEAAAAGKLVGWFAPDFKTLSEAYLEIEVYLAPLKKRANQDKFFRTRTGGKIEFWSLENEKAGRSRKYDLVVIDEAAFAPAHTMDVWRKAIKPTLTDRFGRALVISNTKGALPENFFWQICNDPKHGFICHHAPTSSNPTIPELWGPDEEARVVEALGPGATTQEKRDWLRHDELERLRKNEHPLVYAQEYGAEFVNWSGQAFFPIDKLLDENGLGLDIPQKCDYVFATVDTAVKSGQEHDGTAICFWARNVYNGTPLILLDWDIIQVDGDLLEVWLAAKMQELVVWSRRCGARRNPNGTWVEDKATGSVLIMAGQRRGFDVRAIPSPLTALGKDERAVSVSGYHFRGEVKMTQEAHDKRVQYKGATVNHFESQVGNFRVGIDNKFDDLLDTYTYGISIALGDGSGI